MKRTISLVLCFAGLITLHGLTHAQSKSTPHPSGSTSDTQVVLPPGITEEMLAPPPVPSFMLIKTSKTLTEDEMVQQAREAELKAGIKSTAKP